MSLNKACLTILARSAWLLVALLYPISTFQRVFRSLTSHRGDSFERPVVPRNRPEPVRCERVGAPPAEHAEAAEEAVGWGASAELAESGRALSHASGEL